MRNVFGRGYHAAWYPDTKHTVGAYGRMSDGLFVTYGLLTDLGLDVPIDIDQIPSKLEINASRSVTIAAKIKGVANAAPPHLPEASAGLGIEFKEEGGFVIAADHVFEDRIAAGENLLDRMGTTELAANQFRMTQTREKLAKEGIQGQERAIDTHRQVGQEVREAIRRIGGTMPESLPHDDRHVGEKVVRTHSD